MQSHPKASARQAIQKRKVGFSTPLLSRTQATNAKKGCGETHSCPRVVRSETFTGSCVLCNLCNFLKITQLEIQNQEQNQETRNMAVKPFLKPYSLSCGKGFTFNTTGSTGVEICNPCLRSASMPSQGRVGPSTGVLPFWIGTTCANSVRSNFAHRVLCNCKGATVCSRPLSTVQSKTVGTLSEVSPPNKKRTGSVLQAKKGFKPGAVQSHARVVSHGKQLDQSQRPASPQPTWLRRNPTGWSRPPTPFGQTNLALAVQSDQCNGKGQDVGSTPRKGARVPEGKQTTQDVLPSVRVVQSKTLKQATVPTTANTLGAANPFNPPFNLSSNQRVCLKAQGGFNRTQTRLPIYFDKAKTGVIYLYCTSNNTVCTLVDSKGVTKGWASCGSMGFKSARKSTAYASQATAEKIGLKAKEVGFKWAFLVLKGIGRGKESGVRALRKSGVEILGVLEKTGISHNGCRPPKKRRV